MLIADIGLPGMSGIDMIRIAKAHHPDLDIMAHTVCDDRDPVFSAIKAGATGYLIKGSTSRELVEARHELRNGGAPMSPKIARSVIREFQDEDLSDPYLLSGRERDVLSCVEQGLSYKEISNTLNISPHTVHTHIKKIYEKLQAKNKRDALTKARRKGII